MMEILAFISIMILAVSLVLSIGSGNHEAMLIPIILLGAGWLAAAIVGWV